MSVESGNAFAALQGGPPDTSHLENGFHARAQALGDMIIGAFDKGMTAATAKAGDMASSLGTSMASATAAVSNSGFSPFPGGKSEQPKPDGPEIAIEKSQGLPDHVKSQAMAAVGGGAGVGMPTIQASNMQHVDMSQQVSPPVTYAGIGASQSIGIV